MIISIDQSSAEPLYLQLRAQIIKAIAQGELQPGQALPSVRALAADLGINLHTVNKAYAVLRDEGYVLMRGRSGACIADPCETDRADAAQAALARMEDDLFSLALAHRARGGARGAFLECAAAQAARAYDVLDRPETAEQRAIAKAKKEAPGRDAISGSALPAQA
ncbi:GntR family transcriptional regulator [Adlercreutzia murintestinalis]|uniref:GntR family transcriptional regulator n=1 Tax=Adlercreutzia murintestinalis TaxID=2941325 RepID=UPI00203E7E59|nr:GntR family transcriptional regulator [Adlercreutzia murintestinalis]